MNVQSLDAGIDKLKCYVYTYVYVHKSSYFKSI
jgi:hypothetical protein